MTLTIFLYSYFYLTGMLGAQLLGSKPTMSKMTSHLFQRLEAYSLIDLRGATCMRSLSRDKLLYSVGDGEMGVGPMPQTASTLVRA
ncbi:hypothetical protein BD414DRAFT_483536 [Trametes punicea]|nr:hypothetical protein BD414DRAFT_483536 [Trametes punicea]